MKQLSTKIRVAMLLLLAGLITLGLSSACNIIGIGGGEEEPEGPVAFDILAPPMNVKALVGSPIQIQSAHPDGNKVSRVDLLVSREGEPAETLIRSDVPENGVVVQQWVPRQPGLYTIKVRGVKVDDSAPSEFVRQIRVIDSQSSGVAIAQVGAPPTQIEPTVVVATPAPTLTPAAVPSDAGAAFVVAAAVAPEPTPTPIPRYPPPPPAPGVPWGPTQDHLPNFTAPVCDAAEFLGVYEINRSRRVSVTEPNDVAAKAAAGTTIHRVWRLRNIGTCTWGPGYELAFYGGRPMGSGGVAFESTFPAEPARRNRPEENRLIVPEGKPNQIAILEVLLNVPTVPGIHQSYWRMRNPHGVYFGPIIGITLEVVRECQSEDRTQRIYGAPIINKFEILGVGDVYRPADPVNVLAELGESIVLEWNIINATNFDIVFEDPTGDIEVVSTTDPSSRADFLPTTLGPHRITLFADNGVCVAEATVNVDVLPPDDERFRLDIILASDTQVSTSDANASFSANVQANQTRIEWEHFDREADQFFLVAEAERRSEEEICPLFGWDQACYTQFSDWRQSGRVVLELSGQGGQANVATVANVERRLCPSSFNPEREEYRIIYRVQAFKRGRPAVPEFSNSVEVFCTPTSRLPTEIR